MRAVTWAGWGAFGFLTLVLAIRHTQPIGDGDLFWHLAYARQMLERGTIVPDHTLYSWTPTDNGTIYCAWLSELLLYGLWRLGGWDALFVLRYALVAGSVALLVQFARASGLRCSPGVVAIAMITFVGSAMVAVNLKPEMLSVALTHVVLWAYFTGKRIDRSGRSAWWAFGLIPLVTLVWVNTHGGFTLFGPLLLAILAGEAMNAALGQSSALSRANLRALLICGALSGVAVLVTPYGPAYPLQLLHEHVITSTVPRQAYDWNFAHQSIWSEAGRAHYLIEVLAIMLGISALLFAHRARAAWRDVDAAVVLLLGASTALYLWYLRTTYLLPIAFGYVTLHLLATRVGLGESVMRKAWIAWPALALAGVVGAQSIHTTLTQHGRSNFFGLGINYDNPVDEAEFVAGLELPRDLYNIFDSGGYLLWRLHPRHRVMVDSRAFPFLGWFDDQLAFVNGESFEGFVAKYRADLAVIDLEKRPVWRGFARARDWQLLFYGPTAAVFVRRGAAPESERRALRVAESLATLRNANTLLRVFEFATYIGDHRSAWRLLDRLDGPLAGAVDAERLAAARGYRAAHRAAREGAYADAYAQLDRALQGKVPSDRDRALLTLLRALASGRLDGAERARIEGGMLRLVATE